MAKDVRDIAIHDGTSRATIRDLGTTKALNTALCDDSGAQLGVNENPVAIALSDLEVTLRRLLTAIANPVTIDKTSNRIRETAVIESGTVTTVTTVTGLSNIDSYNGRLLIFHSNINAWNNACRSRIS